MRLLAAEPLEMVPHPGIVSLLEQALEQARKGEIDGVVLLIHYPNGETSDRWATSPNFFWVHMLGVAELWKRRWMARFDEVVP